MKHSVFNQKLSSSLIVLKEREAILNDIIIELKQDDNKVLAHEVEQATCELMTAIQSLEDLLK